MTSPSFDGFHDYEQVKHDAQACARVVKASGLLVFHDYGRFPDEFGRSMVSRAVDEFAASQRSKVRLLEMSLAVVAKADGTTQ